MKKKIAGWALFSVGILVILWLLEPSLTKYGPKLFVCAPIAGIFVWLGWGLAHEKS